MGTGLFETQSDGLKFFRRLPWEKMTTWSIFLLIIYSLRNFLDIIILTFVLSYIAANVVTWLCGRIKSTGDRNRTRQAVVVVVFSVFIVGMVALGFSLLPTIYNQAENLIERLRNQVAAVRDNKVEETIVSEDKNLNDSKTSETKLITKQSHNKLETISSSSPESVPVLDNEKTPDSVKPTDLEELIQKRFRLWIGSSRFDTLFRSKLFESIVSSSLTNVVKMLPSWTAKAGEYLQRVVTILIHFLISVFFSFLIVWDLPKIEDTTFRLPSGRFRNFCREIVPSLLTFSSVMGRAFQAQTIIAFFNTLLTFIGLTFLGIENKYFLSVVVFFCSYIPVLGVFISTIPMSLVAMVQEDGGVSLMIGALIMVTLLHIIEAYLLNPRIMGEKFEMHSLVVLVILLVGKEFFGIWGLLLGIPICHYVFNYIIMGKEDPTIKTSGIWNSLYPTKSSEALVPMANADSSSDATLEL